MDAARNAGKETKMINKLLKNWTITSAGLLLIVSNVIHLIFAIRSGTADEPTWKNGLTGIVGGIGIIFASHAIATLPDGNDRQ